MRHRVEKRKLGRSSAHREAMLRNMVTSLIEHERIETTLPKAKELQRVADRMITLAKKGDLHARRQAMKVIRKKEVARKLFSEVAILFEGRAGGYTRILQLGSRPGDNAPMALIEFVSKTADKKKKSTAKKKKKSAIEAAKEKLPKKPSKKKTAPKKEQEPKVKKTSARTEKKEKKSKKGGAAEKKEG